MSPRETKQVEFNVNQVTEALKKYSGLDIIVEGVWVADISHQWKPDFIRLGVGSVITVVCEVE